MGTTRADLSKWFDEGVAQGATHMVVVCDTWDWEDYPVYVKPGQDVREVEKAHSANMEKVMEVYDLRLGKDEQLAETRAFHY